MLDLIAGISTALGIIWSHIPGWLLKIGVPTCCCWKAAPKVLQETVTKKYASRDLSLGILYVVELDHVELQEAALEKINKILAAAVPLRLTQVYIGFLRVRIGPVVGLRVRVAKLRLKLEFTNQETWETATEAIREAGKKGIVKAHDAAVKMVQKCLKGPSFVKKIPLGIVERFINMVNFQADDLEVSLQCGDMPLIIQASVGLRTHANAKIQFGGTRADIDVNKLGVTASNVELLPPTSKIAVKANLPGVLRTVLVAIDPEEQKKKVKLSVKIDNLRLLVRPKCIGDLLTASKAFGKFGKWKSKFAAEAEGSLTTLSATEMSEYYDALEQKKKVSEFEDKMFTQEILDVHRKVEKWPVPSKMYFDDWLSLCKVKMFPVHHADVKFDIGKMRLEINDNDAAAGDGIIVQIKDVGLRADVSILAAACHPDVIPIKDFVIRAKVEPSIGAIFVLCDPEESFSKPVLEPIRLEESLVQLHGNEVKLHLNMVGVDRLELAEDKQSWFSKITNRARERMHSLRKSEHMDAGEARHVRLTLAPRAIWKIQNILKNLVEALPKQVKTEQDIVQAENLKAQAMVKVHREKVRKVFKNFDTDKSDRLEEAEVVKLVEDIYGSQMTIKELQRAATELFQATDSDQSGGVECEELQDYFVKELHGEGATGSLVLRLGEFGHAVDEYFDPLASFSEDVACGVDMSTVDMKLIQLRWIRTIKNFKKGVELWNECLVPYAPELKNRSDDDKTWKLKETVLASDFWNSPVGTITGGLTGHFLKMEFRADIQLMIEGVSLRIQDTLQPCSQTRLMANLSDVQLAGSACLPEGKMPEFKFDMMGDMALDCEYLNDYKNVPESFVEDWRITLDAKGSCINITSPKHLVVNFTPPLLHAVGFVMSCLELANAESNEWTAALIEQNPNAPENYGIGAWLWNGTGHDIEVSLQGPEGTGPITTCSRQAPHWKIHPVQLLPAQCEHKAKISACANLKGFQWLLHISGTSPDGKKWILTRPTTSNEGEQPGAPINVSGMRMYKLHDENNVEIGYNLVVHLTVEVRCSAPVIFLHGSCFVVNNTTRKISFARNAGERIAIEAQGPPTRGPLGGGAEITFQEGTEEIKTCMPTDEQIMTYCRPQTQQDAHDDTEDVEGMADKFFIVSKDSAGAEVRTEMESKEVILKLGMRCTQKVDLIMNNPDTPVYTRTMTSPLLIQNALPDDMFCDAFASEDDLAERGDQERRIPAGDKLGFDKLPLDKEMIIRFKYGGWVKQEGSEALVPTHSYMVKLKPGYLFMDNLKKFVRKTKFSQHKQVHVVAETHGAPNLQVELMISESTAMLVFYAKYLFANKTGRRLEVRSGALLSKEAQTMMTESQMGETWDNGSAPDLAAMHADDGEKVYLRLHGFNKTGNLYAWNDVQRGELQHWPSNLSDEWTTDWSEAVSISIANSGRHVKLGYKALTEPGNPVPDTAVAGYLGVTIQQMTIPFQRSQQINVMPRYIVMNKLRSAVDIWPSEGVSHRRPQRLIPQGLGICQPSGFFAIDGFRSCDSRDSLFDQLHCEKLLSIRLSRPAEVDEIVHKWDPDAMCGEPKLSAKVRVQRLMKHGKMDEETAKQHVMDEFPIVFAKNAMPMRWSRQIAIDQPGDTLLKILELDDETDVIINASVQLINGTLHVTLAEGTFPYCIENRSVNYTVVFQQENADPAFMEGEESNITVKPSEYHRFLFPDPDKPTFLIGRIRGAGDHYVAKYDFANLSIIDRDGLPFPLASGPLLTAEMKLDGNAGVLVLSDPDSSVGGKQSRKDGKAARFNHALSNLEVNVFLAGAHFCLVDTQKMTVEPTDNEFTSWKKVNAPPEELLAATIDYIQLSKAADEWKLSASVHHFQVDDFNNDQSFIFGPLDTGFNSKRNGNSDLPDFQALPWFSLELGLNDLLSTQENLKKGVFTLQSFALAIGEMEVTLDVPKLLQIVFKMNSWLSVADQLSIKDIVSTAMLVRKQFPTGIIVPAAVQKSCYCGQFDVSRIALTAELKFTSLDKDSDTFQDPDQAMQELGPKLPPAAQSGLSALSHMSLSFAQAAPKFDFAAFESNNMKGTIAPIVSSIKHWYTRQIAAQAVAVLGSVRLLGDPAKVVGEVSSGFHKLYKESKEEAEGQRASLGHGVKDFSVSIGVAAFGFFADLTGTWADTIGGIAGPPLSGGVKPLSLSEGVDQGMSVLSQGFTHGITDVVVIPRERIKEFEDYGISGVAMGGLLGTYSILGRPAEGMLGFLAQVSRGAEGSIHSRTMGSNGLRRPPRRGFGADEHALPKLEEGFFWPSWEFKIAKLTLPALWKEPRVLRLVISMAQARNTVTASEVIVIVRGEAPDTWTLLNGGAEENQDENKSSGRIAYGRVGELRGPFRIQVEADLEGNVAYSKPFRQIVGYGVIPTEQVIEKLQTAPQEKQERDESRDRLLKLDASALEKMARRWHSVKLDPESQAKPYDLRQSMRQSSKEKNKDNKEASDLIGMIGTKELGHVIGMIKERKEAAVEWIIEKERALEPQVVAVPSPLTEGECGISVKDILGKLIIRLTPRIEKRVSMDIVPIGDGIGHPPHKPQALPASSS